MARSWGWLYSRPRAWMAVRGQGRLPYLPRYLGQPHQTYLGHRYPSPLSSTSLAHCQPLSYKARRVHS